MWGDSSVSEVRAPSSTNSIHPGLPPLNTQDPSISDASAWATTSVSAFAESNAPISEDKNSNVIGNTSPTSGDPAAFVVGNIESDMLANHRDDSYFSADVARVDEPVDPEENLWSDYGKSGPQQAFEEIVCPAHGKLCSRGICKDYKRLKKDIEMEKKAAERAFAREERDKEKSKRRKAGGSRKCLCE